MRVSSPAASSPTPGSTSRIGEQLGRNLQKVRSVVVRNADQPQWLLELVGAEAIDLVVLSAHGVTCNRERSFGSVTTHLLSHAPVPIVVLQDLASSELHVAHEATTAMPRLPLVPKRGTA